MKAIGILKEQFEFLKNDIDGVWIDPKRLDEAIKELESLENINCDGCKYYLSDNGNYPLEPCGECSRWYSDRWESK